MTRYTDTYSIGYIHNLTYEMNDIFLYIQFMHAKLLTQTKISQFPPTPIFRKKKSLNLCQFSLFIFSVCMSKTYAFSLLDIFNALTIIEQLPLTWQLQPCVIRYNYKHQPVVSNHEPNQKKNQKRKTNILEL